MGDIVCFSLVVEVVDVVECDILIYYWLKNKLEVQFQLMNLFFLLLVGSDIFVVGENCSGVCSVEQMLVEYVLLNKVDSVCCCGFYYGCLEKQLIFDVDVFWGEYILDNLMIKILLGVFSCDGLDVGSQLLFFIFELYIKGKVFDVGCGVGVLVVVLVSYLLKVCFILCDVSVLVVEVSCVMFVVNGLVGDVFVSNVFFEVNGCFDMIIFNLLFYDGLQISFEVVQVLICGVVCYLNSGGELCIVVNVFLLYLQVLDEMFGFYEVIVQIGCFKVYCIIMICQVKK